MILGSGVYPAAVTPFDEKGQIDYPGVLRLLAWYRAGGCAGVVLAGTTGEGPSLSAVEKRDLVKFAATHADDLKIVLGIATPSLHEATWLAKQAGQAGAHALLVMPPAYFRDATVEGLLGWFRALLDASPLPVLAYNFPKMTGIPLSARFLAQLADHPKLMGVKDSSGEVANLDSFPKALPGKELFVGDETLLGRALQNGWTGTISGAANVLPKWLSQIVREWPADQESAETKLELLKPVIMATKQVTQPAAHKTMLERLGVMSNRSMRLPLVEFTDEGDALWTQLSPWMRSK